MSITEQGARLYRDAAILIRDVETGEIVSTMSARRERLAGYYPLEELLPAIDAMQAALGYEAGIDGEVGRNELANYLLVDLLTTTRPEEISEGQGNLLKDAALRGLTNTTGFAGWTYVFTDFLVPVSSSTIATEEEATIISTPGWDAGAVSAAAAYSAARCRFRVQTGMQFVIGLQEGDPLVPTTRFVGLYFTGDWFFPMFRRPFGDEGNILSGLTPGLGFFIPRYAEGNEFLVEFRKRTAIFKSFDPSGQAVVNQSFLLGAADEETAVYNLGVAIYQPGSWVEGLEITQLADADVRLPAMRGLAGLLRNGAKAPFPKMTTQARLATRSNAVLPAMKTAGGYPYAFSYTTLPRLRTQGTEVVIEPGPPRSGAMFPAMRTSMSIVTGGVGNADTMLPAMKSKGGRATGEVIMRFPALTTFAAALPPGEAVFYSLAGIAPPVTGYALVLASFSSGVAGASTLVGAAVFNAALNGGVNAASSLSATAVLNAILSGRVTFDGDPGSLGAPMEVWVMNLANKATSSYDNFGFNSFMTVGGKTYGVKEDGVFALEGSTDDGEPIRASVSFGQQDFGSKAKKNMLAAYVGVSSTDRVYLKITTPEGEYVYVARNSSEALKQQRIDVGRGLQATFFTFELFNQDGSDLDIESATFVAADFNRRI